MPGAPTPNLGLTVPTVGGDVGTWGNELNTDLAILDGLGAFSALAVNTSGVEASGIFPEAVILATGGVLGITRTLPNPAVWKNKIFTYKKVDAGAGPITIVTPSGLIDGAATYVLFNQYQTVRLMSDGVNVNVVGTSG
jgi:hypothetical protein